MSVNWRRLIRSIKNENAILFIGPDIEQTEDGKIVYQYFSEKILKEYGDDVKMDKDGFFFFLDPDAKSDVIYDMKEFYEEFDFAVDIYKEIASLPFHLIISVSPDDGLHNVFNDNGVKHQFKYFTGFEVDIDEFSIKEPFIFNLFGLATKGKYIFTQEDYFNYLKAILGDNLLPKEIIGALSDANNYIFVGFDFEKWYNRLLLMILNFHARKDGQKKHAIQSSSTDELVRQLIERQFDITFIDENVMDFFNTLHSKIQEEESQLLRPLIPIKEALQQQTIQKQEFVEEYKKKINLSNDPQEKARFEQAVEELEKEIEKLIKRLKTL